MIVALKHPHESDRLKALNELKILDTAPERPFNDLIELAARLCDVPIALFSLVDSERQWFKARRGLEVSQTSRDIAFCAHTILQDRPLVIPDTRTDPRFQHNPLVTSYPFITFYAGLPIFDPRTQLPIGTLCVIDQNPRQLTHSQLEALSALKNQLQNLLDLRGQLTVQETLKRKLEIAQRVAKLGSWTVHLPDRRIEWSDQMFQLFSRQKHQGPPQFGELMNYIHPDDLRDCLDRFQQATELSQPFMLRFRVVSGNKTQWFESVSGCEFDDEGNLIALSGTCQDITEKAEAEAALEQQRLGALHAARMASLGELSAGVAHEINNPLAIIKGTVELLQIHRLDDEQFAKKTQQIQRAVERIIKIVNGLRKYSRTSDDDTQPTPESVDSILRESLTLAEPKAKRQNATILTEFGSQSAILCNPIEIEQVIVNLINNAVDAVELLTNKQVKVKSFDDGNSVVIQVIDTGPPIPDNVAAKIFQPFFTTKEVGKGTGLGLSICKGIIDQHKGLISLNRTFSTTCFEVRLPIFRP